MGTNTGRRPRITIMMGFPRSGKSTWIKENRTNEIVVSADELRKQVYGQQFFAEGEPLMWAIRGVMLKELIRQRVDIIIDETNTKRERREPIIKLAKENWYEVVGVVTCGTTPDELKARAIKDGMPNLIPVIDRMIAQFEPPLESEGFEEIIKVEMNH
jgi:predicted kinase